MFKALSLLLTVGVCAVSQTQSAIDENNRGSALFAALHYREAEVRFIKAAAFADAAVQMDPAERATIYVNLAAVYRAEGRFPEAERFYLKARQCAPDKSTTSNSALRGLALIYLAQGKFAQAERLARAAVENLENGHAPTSDLAIPYNDLALVLLESGKWQESEQFASHAISNSAPASPAAGNALNIMGRAALARKEGERARNYFTRSMQVLQSELPPNDPALAAVAANLGRAEDLCGDSKHAITTLNHAIASLEYVKGATHPDVASALNILGSIYEKRKNYNKARSLFERSLAIDTQAFGPQSPRVAVDLSNLGSVAFFQHRWDDAESLMVRALFINRSRLGEIHPETGELAANLAFLYSKRQRYGEAKPLFRQAIASREANYGNQDPGLAKLLKLQADTFRREGEFSEAQLAEARYMKITVRNLLFSGERGHSSH